MANSGPTAIADLVNTGDLVINDGYRAKNSELSTRGIPFARAQNINNGFRFEEADCFPVEDLHKVGIKISQPGDVVFTSKGTVGRFAFVREDTPRFVYSPQLCFWRSLNPERVLPRWLYYWMQSWEFFSQYSGVSGQTDMADYVSLRDQRNMHITLPSLEEQKAVADVLGALDDRIQLNRSMNETLEGIARTLFKSWFLDFDHVRAKVTGRQPHGLSQKIAALFPDAFDESELGEIPEGWKIEPIGDVVEAVGGGTPSTKNPAYWDDGIHYFATPKSLSGLSSPILLETERKVTDAGLAKISSGLLPVGTVLLSSRAPVGYLAITQVPVCINQGFIAMICEGKVSNYYVLNWAHANMAEIKMRAGGTTFAEISKRNFRPIPALVPPAEVIATFDAVVEPHYNKIWLNLEESRTLAELRDTLLPKLISGELRVPDAEKLVEATL